VQLQGRSGNKSSSFKKISGFTAMAGTGTVTGLPGRSSSNPVNIL
jgi:hypothetical protein